MEKNQKNAAEVKTSVPDLIPSNYCKKAEALGWVIDEDKVCGVFTFRQGSPAGEDYSFDLYADDDFSDGVAAAVRVSTMTLTSTNTLDCSQRLL